MESSKVNDVFRAVLFDCGEKIFFGLFYAGHYEGGVRQGYGVCKFACGDVFEGSKLEHFDFSTSFVLMQLTAYASIGYYDKGNCHNKGKYTSANGSVYEGDYKHGKKHGKGCYKYASGDIYAGGWSEGLQDGFGEYTYADGEVYRGEYCAGQRHGQGEYIRADGSPIFRGRWSNNNPVLCTNDPLLTPIAQMMYQETIQKL